MKLIVVLILVLSLTGCPQEQYKTSNFCWSVYPHRIVKHPNEKSWDDIYTIYNPKNNSSEEVDFHHKDESDNNIIITIKYYFGCKPDKAVR